MSNSNSTGEGISTEMVNLHARIAELERGRAADNLPAAVEPSELLKQAIKDRAAATAAANERARFYAMLMDIPAGILLLRGTDMVAELVNPRYLALVGKKDIIGKTLYEFLPEIRGQGFMELLLGVLETGKPFIGRELPARIDLEGNGTLSDLFFTFIYQPVHEPDGTRSGVLVHAVEVTDHVLARRALQVEVQERQQAEERLQAQIQERARIEQELRAKLDIIQTQEEAILALATPILQIWNGVLALPVIGAVDSARAARMMEGLLREITRTRARYAVIDLTGVDVLDTNAADHLLKIVRASALLGSRCLVSGVSPRMAQTIVGLNLELVEIMTFSTLETALRYAIRHLSAPS